jgi:hypothetical protein
VTNNTSMVSRKLSRVDVGFSRRLPGADMLLTCQQVREEGQKILYSMTHFTTQWSVDGFLPLRRFDWDNSTHLVQSIDLQISSVLINLTPGLGQKVLLSHQRNA